MNSTASQTNRTLTAQTERLGVRYRSSLPIAVPLVLVIVVAMIAGTMQVDSIMSLVGSDGRLITDFSRFSSSFAITLVATFAYLFGMVLWSLWIARVIANIPALVARWPKYGWLAAALGHWIPIICLKRPLSVVREVCSQLTVRSNGVALVAVAWWTCILISYFGPSVIQFGRALAGNDASVLQSAVVAGQFGQMFTVAAGIFACGVVYGVERLQYDALRQRDQTVMSPDGASVA